MDMDEIMKDWAEKNKEKNEFIEKLMKSEKIKKLLEED